MRPTSRASASCSTPRVEAIMSDAILLWPAAYLLHSSLLLVVAWIASRWIRHPVLAEALWRCAFFAAFFTASLQPLAQLRSAAAAPAVMPTLPALALGEVQADAHAPRTKAVVQPAQAAAQAVPADRSAQAEARPAWRWWLPSEMRLALLAAAAAWALIAGVGLSWPGGAWVFLPPR